MTTGRINQVTTLYTKAKRRTSSPKGRSATRTNVHKAPQRIKGAF